MEPVKKWRQYFASILANLLSLSIGVSMGWTSPVIPKLADENLTDSPLYYPVSETSEECGWITSLLPLGAVFGPFLAWVLVDRIGRKWCLFISSVFIMISYIILIFSFKLWMMFLARFLQGIGTGFGMTTIPIYNGEISSDDCRGPLGALFQLFNLTGLSYAFIVGPLLTYTQLQWACIPFSILFITLFWLIPETPYYCVAKGKMEEATKSLKFLRGQSEKGVQDELQSIKEFINKSSEKKGTIFDLIKNKGNLKAFGICVGLISGQQFSGANALVFNVQSIFEASKAFDVKYSVIIISVVHIIVGVLGPIVANYFGRKKLLLTSSIVLSLSLIGLGSFFYIQSISGNVSSIQWLPVTCLVIFITAFCFGYGQIPWIVLSEILPSNVKHIASTITVSFCWFFGFIITRWYPILSTYGVYYTYWGFAILCIISFCFVSIFLFETKGLSLKEIHDIINSK